ncbi:nuclease-related domain-containing protein [Pseudonocardia sp. HH130630-07]|uniref:nuclease-related domain-containing protein n=1 Tax=Pseudonocardia sp. HH130630-07 TaxID=1690815 RepID=UPI0012EA87A2|nr:nuclease-related domain-containing protein [Pseudonocardia sp. HH130630-07]
MTDLHGADRLETTDRSRTLDLARHYPGRRAGHVAARVRGAGHPDRSWRLGADGEIRTAHLLEQLTGRTRRDRLLGRSPRWRVLHSVPLEGGAADLDHVLIGPPGICVINSRHHRHRSVLLDGERLVVAGVATDAVPRARAEAARVRELLLPRVGGGSRIPDPGPVGDRRGRGADAGAPLAGRRGRRDRECAGPRPARAGTGAGPGRGGPGVRGGPPPGDVGRAAGPGHRSRNRSTAPVNSAGRSMFG